MLDLFAFAFVTGAVVWGVGEVVEGHIARAVGLVTAGVVVGAVLWLIS